MIELKYFSSTFYKVELNEQPLSFKRKFVFNPNLPPNTGWADKSGDKWFAMYEKDGVLIFRADAWTCPVDGDTECRLTDRPQGDCLLTISARGNVLFEHRYAFAKWKKLQDPAYAQGDRLTDDFFAWVADIWKAKAVAT